MSGLLIAFEGIDGAGKSTQIRRLAATLRESGKTVVTTAEPTTGPWGKKIRESAISGRMSPTDELAAFVADRRQHVEEVLAPALAKEQIVLIDRYFYSTVAYQGARGLTLGHCFEANAFAPIPDILIVFDLDPKIGLERVQSRGEGADLFEKETELAAARKIFLEIEHPNRLTVDATETAEAIEAQISAHVRASL